MKVLFIDVEKCCGCKSCELACAVAHSQSKNMYDAISEVPVPKKRIRVEQLMERTKIAIQCRHCGDAKCVSACISGAMYRDEQKGRVDHDIDRCIGCWSCVMCCPLGVVFIHKQKKIAVKCDLCDELDQPACVTACPQSALMYLTPEEMEAINRRKRVTY